MGLEVPHEGSSRALIIVQPGGTLNLTFYVGSDITRQEINNTVVGEFKEIIIQEGGINMSEQADQRVINYGTVQGVQAHEVSGGQVNIGAAVGKGQIDIDALSNELSKIKTALKADPDDNDEKDIAVGVISEALRAAQSNDVKGATTALERLKSVGGFVLGVAEKVGAAFVVAWIKAHLGL